MFNGHDTGASLARNHAYPPIAIGCSFFRREPNYQAIVTSIEAMAAEYPAPVHAYVYLSEHTEASAASCIASLNFDRDRFTFVHGANRLDEQKYLLPLRAESPFIVTLDDDCCFGPDTLVRLMHAYQAIISNGAGQGSYPAIGWFGTEMREGRLLTPIENRYLLEPGQLKQVDYLGSCGCLYRREVLSDIRLRMENWSPVVGAASDLWLSYLISVDYSSPLFITWLDKTDLDEHGHSLWTDHNESQFSTAVEGLVALGWHRLPR